MGPDGHRTLHEAIKQESNTIYKINASEWNNVPTIVYDAFCQIVLKYDKHYALTQKNFGSTTRELDKGRTANMDLENKLEDKMTTMDAQMHQIRRAIQDKAAKHHNELLEKNNRCMNQISTLNKNMEL